MKVSKLMTRGVATCQPTDTLSDAARLMWDRDCGCVPVVASDGSNRLVGVITDRDVCMAAHFRAAAPSDLRVGDVMSTRIRGVGPSETLADAEAIMREAQVRRLPVVDEGQHLLGLISLADLARAAALQRTSKKPEITEAELSQTLEAICTAIAPSQRATPA
jgi:CBS-domain-containing membrane protein